MAIVLPHAKLTPVGGREQNYVFKAGGGMHYPVIQISYTCPECHL